MPLSCSTILVSTMTRNQCLHPNEQPRRRHHYLVAKLQRGKSTTTMVPLRTERTGRGNVRTCTPQKQRTIRSDESLRIPLARGGTISEKWTLLEKPRPTQRPPQSVKPAPLTSSPAQTTHTKKTLDSLQPGAPATWRRIKGFCAPPPLNTPFIRSLATFMLEMGTTPASLKVIIPLPKPPKPRWALRAVRTSMSVTCSAVAPGHLDTQLFLGASPTAWTFREALRFFFWGGVGVAAVDALFAPYDTMHTGGNSYSEQW